MKSVKKSLSLLLSVLMVLSLVTAGLSVSAAEGSGKITFTSNVAGSAEVNYTASNDKVTVTYYLQTEHFIVNTQGYIEFDSTVLSPASETSAATCMPNMTTGSVLNTDTPNKLYFNTSNVAYYDFYDANTVYFTVTFDIIGTGNTNVNFVVEVLTGNDVENYSMATSADDIDLVDYENVVSNEFTMTTNAALHTVPQPSTEPSTQPSTVEPTTQPSEPAYATIYAAAPMFAEKKKAESMYFAYSSSSNVSDVTRLQMTNTGKKYFLASKEAGLLKENVNLDVYKLDLTAAQAAEINAATYSGFMDYSKGIRTSYIYSKAVTRANIDSAGYGSRAHTIEELDGKMFVITDSSSNDTKRYLLGNWVSSSGSEVAATIYMASPESSSPMGTPYFRYSTDSNISTANRIMMEKTDIIYNNTLSASNLSTGTWKVYELQLTADQVSAADSGNYAGFSSEYGGEVRTQYSYANSVARAKVDENSTTYNSAKTGFADLNGKTFIINGSVSNNYKSYIGYWANEATAIKTVTFKIAVPNKVGNNNVGAIDLIYNDDYDYTTAEAIRATHTNESFTPDSIETSLIASSTKWSVYSLTLTADQYRAIESKQRAAFASGDKAVCTAFTWSGNILRAGTGNYENPYDTSTTLSFEDVDGMTFVMCGSASTNTKTMLGY